MECGQHWIIVNFAEDGSVGRRIRRLCSFAWKNFITDGWTRLEAVFHLVVKILRDSS